MNAKEDGISFREAVMSVIHRFRPDHEVVFDWENGLGHVRVTANELTIQEYYLQANAEQKAFTQVPPTLGTVASRDITGHCGSIPEILAVDVMSGVLSGLHEDNELVFFWRGDVVHVKLVVKGVKAQEAWLRKDRDGFEVLVPVPPNIGDVVTINGWGLCMTVVELLADDTTPENVMCEYDGDEGFCVQAFPASWLTVLKAAAAPKT